MIMEVIKKSLISPVTALCAVQDFVLVGMFLQATPYFIYSGNNYIKTWSLIPLVFLHFLSCTHSLYVPNV